MPLYDYECQTCGNKREELHGFDAKPPECQCGAGSMLRLVGLFAMKQGKTMAQRKAEDVNKRRAFMSADLKENHGVHAYKPVPNSEKRGFEQTYKDVKKLGRKVKDQMQEIAVHNAAMIKQKQRKWMEGALKRTPKKREQMHKARQQAAFDAKSITLSR